MLDYGSKNESSNLSEHKSSQIGVEPITLRLTAVRSNQLSYWESLSSSGKDNALSRHKREFKSRKRYMKKKIHIKNNKVLLILKNGATVNTKTAYQIRRLKIKHQNK